MIDQEVPDASPRHIQAGSTSAERQADEAGATYAFDAAIRLFLVGGVDAQGCRFITRLKTHTRPILLEEREVEAGGSIIADRVIRLANRLARNRRNPLEKPLREVHVRIDTGKSCTSLATTSRPRPRRSPISTRRTADIELFSSLGQTSKIRRATSRHATLNAIRTQIAAALIAYLLLRMAHAAQRTGAEHPHLRPPCARQPNALPHLHRPRRTATSPSQTPRSK